MKAVQKPPMGVCTPAAVAGKKRMMQRSIRQKERPVIEPMTGRGPAALTGVLLDHLHILHGLAPNK